MISLPLFRQLRRRLRQLLRIRGQSREDIEDLIQDAFLRLEMYYRRGCEVQVPEAFIVRTALRLSSNARRSVHRRARVEQAFDQLPPVFSPPAPEEALAYEQSADALQGHLSELPELTRDIFLLHRLDGYTYTQIAQLYGITNKAVERRIARAMIAVHRGHQEALPSKGSR